MKKQFLLCFSILIFSINLNAQSPVVAYHFHNGTYYDIAGSNFHLEAVDQVTVTNDAAGIPNSAVHLNGGFLDLGDVDELEFVGGSITISAWIKMESATEWTAVVNKWQGGTGGYYLGINPDNTRMRFNVLVDNIEDTAPVVLNEWIHFAASYDGNTIKLFRNGVLANQKVAPGAIAPSSTSFRLGRQSDVATAMFFGDMDEVLVYGEALSDQAINELYTNGAPKYGNDIAVVTMESAPFVISPANVPIEGKIFNVGLVVVTSFDLHWSDGVNTFSQSITGLNIQPSQEYNYSHPDMLDLSVASENEILVWAENPNGVPDENAVNNSNSGTILGVAFIPSKRVFVEEGTGTWCTWCPRGAVGMEYMAENYPDDFVGVAFHSSDPMEIPDFITNFNAFPTARLDRNLSLDPNAQELETQVLARLEEFTLASIEQSLTYKPETREITTSVSSQFAMPVQGDYRFNIIVIEDHVTGTGNGYAQVNAYSGGQNGPMGGYENLPNPVPADQMVYDQVGRAVLGDYDGFAGSLPTNLETLVPYDFSTSYTLPIEFDESEISIIAVVMDVNGNEVLNAISTHLSDAMVLNTGSLDKYERMVKVFPNPTTDMANIKLDLEENADVNLTVFNALGQKVASRAYGTLVGEILLPVNTHSWSEGLYHLHLKIDGKIAIKKLVVSKN